MFCVCSPDADMVDADVPAAEQTATPHGSSAGLVTLAGRIQQLAGSTEPGSAEAAALQGLQQEAAALMAYQTA